MNSKYLAPCVLAGTLGLITFVACQRETIEVTRVVTEKETIIQHETVIENETIVVEVTAAPTPETTAQLTARDPKTFIIADVGEIITLDPNLAYDVDSFTVIMNVMEGLIFFKRENMTEYVPMLATEVPSLENGGISVDGLTYIFKVRRGVEFHAGGALTPSDFEYTFERGLLQSDPNGPQWLLLEPLLGYSSGDITEEIADGAYAGDPDGLRANAAPEELMAACQKVKAAVEADDGAFTLTFHLAQPWGPFLATLAQSWGSALDKEWAIENGAWDGSCETWQDHYVPGLENDPLATVINGTGPYMLDYWTPGEGFSLVANEDYWRPPGDEIWPGSPSGPPQIQRVIYKFVPDWGTRLAILQAGDAEWVYVPAANRPQVDGLVGEICDYRTNECTPTDNPNGRLRKWPGLPRVSRMDVFMNFDVRTDDAGNNLFIGSGKLDGNGVPPDFFSDIHVRRAFNYCFDYEAFIQDAQNGEGVRNNGPIIIGMLGYNPEGPMYEYDLDKCGDELAQAWDGVLPETGFRLQMVYATGWAEAETAAAILQANLRSVNPKFEIELLGLPWPRMLESFRAGQLPIVASGWLEDIHDPHNWAQPFTVGTYAQRQNLPDDLQAQFQKLVTAGAMASDPQERELIYFELQKLHHEHALQITLSQLTAARYEPRWVQGFYHNPMMLVGYIYAFSLTQ